MHEIPTDCRDSIDIMLILLILSVFKGDQVKWN
jgi:hypothetical protein